MLMTEILRRTNDLLAGETLSYLELRPHFDSVIDDINQQMNTTFPAFSELGNAPIEYTAFPDRYIRSVVCLGAAVYFYVTDEEGGQPPAGYATKYRENVFYMTRDYLPLVPEEYQGSTETGSVGFSLTGSDHANTGVRQEDFRI